MLKKVIDASCCASSREEVEEHIKLQLISAGFDISRYIEVKRDPCSFGYVYRQRSDEELQVSKDHGVDVDWELEPCARFTPKTIVTFGGGTIDAGGLDEEINKYGDDVPIVNNDTPKSEYTKWAKDAHKSCLSKLYEWFRGEVFDEPDKRKSEKEPDWFRNRHCSMAEFREKHGK